MRNVWIAFKYVVGPEQGSELGEEKYINLLNQILDLVLVKMFCLFNLPVLHYFSFDTLKINVGSQCLATLHPKH